LHSKKREGILALHVAKVSPSPRLITLMTSHARLRGTRQLHGIILAGLPIVLGGCATGPAGTVQPRQPLVAHATFELSMAVPEERATKAKAAALGVPKDSAALGAVLTEDSIVGDAIVASTTARCPADMSLVEDRVCVDRWEGSLVERVLGGELPWSPFAAVDGHERQVRAVSLPGVIPQGYISGAQAMAACTASGKRLCSTDEWMSACRGSANTIFPYGATRQRSVCNDDVRHVHPVAEVGALLDLKAGELWTTTMNNPLVNQLSRSLLPTGERSGCTNAYGVFDMVGNLHEWVDDPSGTFRGGYYMDTSLNGDGCKYATAAHDFTYHDYSTGFRCCMDPEQVE
jgi:formylglycine-generating enzyme